MPKVIVGKDLGIDHARLAPIGPNAVYTRGLYTVIFLFVCAVYTGGY